MSFPKTEFQIDSIKSLRPIKCSRRGPTRSRAPLLAVLITACLASGGPVPGAPGKPAPIPTLEERAEALRFERGRPRGAEENRIVTDSEQAALPEGAGVGVDALHYTLDLRFNPKQPTTISGTVTGRFEVLAAGLTTLVLDFYDSMNVSSVTKAGTPLSFIHEGMLLTITLDRPYAAGEVIEVAVTYSGTPVDTGMDSFVWTKQGGQPLFWSLSEPTYAPTWWPSVDDPADKATADMIFTVDTGLIAVSNGILVSTTDLPGNLTEYHWQTTYPITTYLISITCTDYSTYADWYTPAGGGGPMEVRYWVYPSLVADAQASFAVTVPMMEIFAALFGEYPFIDEKYGMALFGFGGAMEHQTVTSYGARYVDGTDEHEWLIAHETAHQWWGDSVTLEDWRETWLHEGFATHSEALYFEVRNGWPYYHAYMESLDPGSFSGPLYDNSQPFGITVYHKGAWVLHMLRHVIGDDGFFALLPTLQTQHRYGNVSTDLLRLAAEAEWGQDLTWFFDEWVYGTGRPDYEWGWSVADTGSGYILHVHIDQTQSGPAFRMPLDARIQTGGGDIDVVLWNDDGDTEFAVPLADPPTGVILDPGNWVLKNATQITLPDADADGVPDSADNCGVTPNPVQENLDGDAFGDACDPDADNDGVLNGSDCAPLDQGSFAQPAEVAALLIDAADLIWDSLAAQAGPGTFYDVIRGAAGDLGLVGGVAGAACFAPGEGGLSVAHGADPGAGGVDYFLVRGRNACGAGTYGDASSGASRINSTCP